MGALTRAFDWSATSLGPPATWPQSLRVTVRIMLNTRHPMFIWWGPDLIQFYNDAYRETMGPERHPSALGGRGQECWAEIWDIIGPQIAYVMSGQGSTWDEDRLIPVTRHGKREDVWWTYSYGPIDLDGRVGGVLVICNDVTDHVNAEKRLQLLNDELKHRVKNTIAVVSAIATQTLRGKDVAADLDNFNARLAAFARAHDILTGTNQTVAPITDVVKRALGPHDTGGERFRVAGPNIDLGSQQAMSLSLAIHELATNAFKYGALSNRDGSVDILWQADNDTGQFEFRWQESSGPRVEPPTRTGFGSRLISHVLAGDFKGKVELLYEPSGLLCVLKAPLTECCPPTNAR